MNKLRFLLSFLLILLILFVPIHQIKAGGVEVIVYVVATTVVATAVYDYVSCDINIIWGGCGGDNGGGGGGGGSPSPTVNISVDPTLIERGQSATVTWSSSDADSCNINWFGNVDLSGSRMVSPSETTEYTLTCSGSGGESSASATLTVKYVDIFFNGSNATLNQPYNLYVPDTDGRLSWESSQVSSCIASGNWSGSKSVNGSENLGTLERGTENPGQGKKYVYTLTCDSLSDTTAAIVWQYPRCSFSADPSSIILPQSSTLSWSCSYADSCEIDQGIGPVSKTSGTQEVRPSQTTTYTLTCNGFDGPKSWQSTVNVGFTPIIREVIPR